MVDLDLRLSSLQFDNQNGEGFVVFEFFKTEDNEQAKKAISSYLEYLDFANEGIDWEWPWWNKDISQLWDVVILNESLAIKILNANSYYKSEKGKPHYQIDADRIRVFFNMLEEKPFKSEQ